MYFPKNFADILRAPILCSIFEGWQIVFSENQNIKLVAPDKFSEAAVR